MDANQQSRIFEIANNANVSISGLRIEHGYVAGAHGGNDSNGYGIAGGDARGGGVLVGAGSSLQIVDCVLADNRAAGGGGSDFFNAGFGGAGGSAFGGAIDNAGTLVVAGTTMVGNQATGGRGGSIIGVLPGSTSGAGDGGAAAGGAIHANGDTELANVQLLRNAASGGWGGFAPDPGATGGNGGTARGGGISSDQFMALAFVSMAGNRVSGGWGEGEPNSTNGTASGTDIATTATLLSRYSAYASVTSGQPTCVAATVSAQGANMIADNSCTGFTQNVSDMLQIIGTTAAPIAYPAWGSPLIDAAADCKDAFGATLSHDVRGVTRPLDGNADGIAACDIGAVESDELFANGFD